MSRIRANTIALGVSFVGTALLAFLQVKILTNHLAPDRFGAWVTMVGVGALLGTLTELGLPQVIIRYGAKYDAEGRLARLRKLRSFALKVHVSAWAIMVTALVLSGPWIAHRFGHGEMSRWLVLLGYLAMASGTLRAINNGSFRSLRRMSFVAWLEVSFSLMVTFGYFIFRHELTVERVFLIFIGCSLLVGLTGILILRGILGRVEATGEELRGPIGPEVRGYWQGAAAAGIFLVAIEFFDKPLLAGLVSLQMVGIFGVASRLALFPRRMLYVPLQVLNPEITHKWEGGRRHELAEDIRLFLKLELGLGLLLIAPLALFARPLVLLVSSPDYLAATPVIWIFAGVIPLLCLHQPLVLFLRAVGHVWLAFAADASWLLIYLGLGACLVRPLGLVGFVAGQVVASVFVLSYTLLVFHRRGFPRPPTGFFLRRVLLALLVWGGSVAGGRSLDPATPIWVLAALAGTFLAAANLLMVLGGFLNRADEDRTIAMLAGNGPAARLARFLFAWPRRVAGRGGLALVLLVPGLLAGSGCGRSLPAGCSYGDEVPGKVRKGIVEAADTLYDRIRKGDAEGIFASTAEPVRSQSDVKGFVTPIAKTYFRFGLPETLTTHALYVIHLVPGVPVEYPIVCGPPERQVELRLSRYPDQASLTQWGEIRGETFQVSTLWWLEEGEWHLGSFTMKPVTLYGKSIAEYETIARTQKEKGNLRNAALLYNLVLDLTVPNGWTKPPGVDALEAAQREIVTTALPSNRLDIWHVGDRAYRVYKVEYRLGREGLDLAVNYEVEDATDTLTVAAEQPPLLDYLRSEFPEYPEVFKTVTLRAAQKGELNLGWFRTYPLVEESKGPGD